MEKKFQFSNVLKVFGYLFLSGWLLQFAARTWWVFELSCHFAVQYLIVICLGVLSCCIYRQWKWATAFGCVLAWQAWVVLHVFIPGQQVEKPQTTPLTIVHFNVLCNNENYEGVCKFLRREQPDFVCLQEVTYKWQRAFAKLRDLYPYQEGIPRSDSFGIVFLSRKPFVKKEIKYFSRAQVPSVIVECLHEQQPITIVATHPLPPRTPEYSALRNSQLVAVANYVKKHKGQIMVIGDLNVTPWSPYFQDFVHTAQLRDSRQGFGVHSTWPSMAPILWIPIDHCLLSRDCQIHKREVKNNHGSDHYPIAITFSIPK